MNSCSAWNLWQMKLTAVDQKLLTMLKVFFIVNIYLFLAECPVCGDMVPHRKINSHLDACLTRTEKKSSLRRYMEIKLC